MAEKVLVIGRGEPTKRQVQLLRKALGAEPEFVAQLQQVNSPKEITEALQRTGAKAVFAFIAHPTVVSALATAKRFAEFDYYIPRTKAVITKTVKSLEEAEQLCKQHNADIINTKILPNGEVSVRCTRTEALMKNPIVQIVAEEEIS